MVIWGGYDGSYLKTGGRWTLTTNLWAPLATKKAPAGRAYAAAVWDGAGKQMIVWGGNGGADYNSGGKYTP